jgi:hypothetical protein
MLLLLIKKVTDRSTANEQRKIKHFWSRPGLVVVLFCPVLVVPNQYIKGNAKIN